MATPLRNEPTSSSRELVQEIVADARKLLGQELELIKLEMQNEWHGSRRVWLTYGVAFLLLGIGLLHLTIAGADLISFSLSAPPWIGYSFAGVGLFTLGLITIAIAQILKNRKPEMEVSAWIRTKERSSAPKLTTPSAT